jgi:hypothetical protein
MKDFKEHYTTYFEPNKKLKTYIRGVVQAIKVSQLNVIMKQLYYTFYSDYIGAWLAQAV